MQRHRSAVPALIAGVLFSVSVASGHFVWLLPAGDKPGTTPAAEPADPKAAPAVGRLVFSETAEPGEVELIDRLEGTEVFAIGSDGKPVRLAAAKGTDIWTLTSPTALKEGAGLWCSRTFGVMSRGGKDFLLVYHAAMAGSPDTVIPTEADRPLRIDAVREGTAGAVRLTVTFRGKPLPDAELTLSGAHPKAGKDAPAKTDAEGRLVVERTDGGLLAARVRAIEATPGTHAGKAYGEVRHYATITVAGK